MSSSIANSEASKTYPKQGSALCKNDFVMIKNRPCKIVEISVTKDEKHGHSKVHITALDIFTKKKLENLLSINDDNFVTLLDLKTNETKDNLCLPNGELGIQIKSAFEESGDQGIIVTVVAACNEEAILSWKKNASK
uniref:Translation elongation factor IF5A C-terminal domain-containing protein n=1 Tax=Panagrolaimus davidi TaxID=227884 RepID=A0A914PV84_9BILA